jgi:NAD(P)-dependent dehydrogenase (short-subunit alcohol dehydrogenase family)
MTTEAPLVGCVAVVTGATKGLGRATAEFLARQGASIGICSRAPADTKAFAERLHGDHGVAVCASRVDVSDRQAVIRFSEQVRTELGDARVVINNAAILGPVGVLDSNTLESWSTAIDINLKGPAYLIAAFRDQLGRTGQGRVINLSGGGIGGPAPMKRTSSYVAAKAGIAGLTEALADELAEIGATINAIAPGALPTAFLDGVLTAGPKAAGNDLFKDAKSRTGQIPKASLEPFFSLLRYLVSPDSAWLNGRVLSARWETPIALEALRSAPLTNNAYRLRRVDNDLVIEATT